MMIKAYLIKVYGDVQGVNYRYFAKNEAKKLGLLGWTKNNQDGSVHLFVQGDEDLIESFIEWCQKGSPMATVESHGVERAEIDPTLRKFEVR